ncbi:FAD-dependent oxidoreductase [Rhizomicrobium electricum]|uniref:4Fe-4S ferredoxin-type domain-containing protein n=1 Tax=Rhizomicrobium electricum TaxID=480070 RepID=A0ABN1EW68_9PROT|nr:FAD-dependent oxidoreductase [Rhizomicrobium electricum]NIJ50043.1 2-oxoacid:acceptor oxidoreductase gamma subunit (pyruvate/2-ketoisovalerate family) [Rhizomicrobium electricum]
MDPQHPAEVPLPSGLSLPLEVRVHGRGGQGGVTCAKLIAALFTQMGCFVQTFGDYGSERSGAPIQAYTRVDRAPIRNANKVYRPDHLLVLDEGLMRPAIFDGVEPGSLLLLNSAKPIEAFAGKFDRYRFGVVDATAIAREQGIGSAAVVIINTTILGAYARLLGLPVTALEKGFAKLGVSGDFAAARQAFEKVEIAEVLALEAPASPAPLPVPPPVASTLEHSKDFPPTVLTGTWSNQMPSYATHDAPCNVACPAGNDVVGFVQALKKGDAGAAAGLLFATQPLPSVCGRVCPAPCMGRCNRAFFDGAVNIRSLERWIGDHAEVQPVRASVPRPLHVAVVGGGPAGLSAAWKLARDGHAVTIFEAGPALGGVLRNGIPAFRLPEAALDRDLERITALGVKVRCNTHVGKNELAQLSHDHDAVIVAVGFGAPVALGVKGEHLANIEQGLDFLDRAKREPVTLSGSVVVIGGGNTAIDCARTAVRCGAASVTIAYRRGRKDMPAIAEEIHDAEKEGVRILSYRTPVAFEGAGAVASALLAEMEAGPPDASGRRRPVVTNRTSPLAAATVLLALGQKTDMPLPDGWSMKEGRAFHGDRALPVYFAGDCATGEGTVTHAIGSGRKAAEAVLGVHAPAAKTNGMPVAPGQIRFDHFEVARPHEDRQIAVKMLAGDFSEVNAGLADVSEAERCFSCGHCTLCDTCIISCPDGVIFRDGAGYRIDPQYCKGCGMCVAECPRGVMAMQEKTV